VPASSRRPRRLSLIATVLAIGLLAMGAAPSRAATAYGLDVYFAAGYERQIDSRTCTAASVAMMMNFIARRDLGLSQMAILRYEQPRDALNDSTQRGSDPLGWSRAATYYSQYTGRPTTYKWEAYSTAMAALRRAAKQIAITGKPVGMLVSHGKHAMVMTGLVSTANPATASTWTLQHIWYSDPYGYAHRAAPATSTPLTRYLELDANSTYDALWYGKYIVIVPQG
jgi:hypothetical protein